jgi:hypothetical protein
VYRGTWKHTDIAAKEYLPHLPGESDPQSPLSEAAKANAQVGAADRLSTAGGGRGVQTPSRCEVVGWRQANVMHTPFWGGVQTPIHLQSERGGGGGGVG